MISNFLVDTFGNTTYLTFVLTETKGNLKIEFILPVSNGLKSLFKSVGNEIYKIVSENPRSIETIIIDEVKYYFSVQRIRHGESIHYGVHVLYSITLGNEELFAEEYSFSRALCRMRSDPVFDKMSETSLKLAEKIRKNTSVYEYLFDFYSNKLNGFFETKRESYFYKINDVIKYTIANYFDEEICPRKFTVNYIDSDMYTQMNLNNFMFFMVNLLLTLIKYSQSEITVDFANNLKTLDIIISGKLADGFFGNNGDVLYEEDWLLSPRHPAFSDFEVVKYFANTVGAALDLDNPIGERFEINVSVSKMDIVFSNLLRVNDVADTGEGIPIYTVDIDDIIN